MDKSQKLERMKMDNLFLCIPQYVLAAGGLCGAGVLLSTKQPSRSYLAPNAHPI